MKRCFVLILCILLLSSCENQLHDHTVSESSSIEAEGTGSSHVTQVGFAEEDGDMFAKRDLRDDIDENGSILITLNGSILISDGNLYINASGDGIDANGTLTISGGYTVVVGPTRGDTATLIMISAEPSQEEPSLAPELPVWHKPSALRSRESSLSA